MERGALAAALMILGMLLIPVGDAISKHLQEVGPYGPGFLAWSRFSIGALIFVPLALARPRWRPPRPLGAYLGRQIVRAALISGTIVCIITAVGKAPLADVYGAFFIGPAVSMLLARLLLGEPVSGAERAAVGLGLAGVALVTRPGLGPGPLISEGLAWALAAGALYGAFLTATRWAAGKTPPMAQMAGHLGLGALITAPLGVGDLIEHGAVETGWVALMAVSSALANLFAVAAYALARAAALAPLVYAQILSAAALGWIGFGALPDAPALAGLGLILAAGLVLALGRRATGPREGTG